jgi:hypothetical protein
MNLYDSLKPELPMVCKLCIGGTAVLSVKVHRKGVAFWRVARRYSRRHCGKHGSAGLLTPCAALKRSSQKRFGALSVTHFAW